MTEEVVNLTEIIQKNERKELLTSFSLLALYLGDVVAGTVATFAMGSRMLSSQALSDQGTYAIVSSATLAATICCTNYSFVKYKEYFHPAPHDKEESPRREAEVVELYVEKKLAA